MGSFELPTNCDSFHMSFLVDQIFLNGYKYTSLSQGRCICLVYILLGILVKTGRLSTLIHLSVW